MRPRRPAPALSKNRLRQIESMLHALRGAMGIRTPDLLNAIEALYQLSYDPINYLQLKQAPLVLEKCLPFNRVNSIS